LSPGLCRGPSIMNPPLPTSTLGQTIRDRRVEKTLGLREFARLIDITPSYLSDIENDRRVPAAAVLRVIATHLNLPFDELMARAGRLDEQTEQYLKRQPQAAVLFRRISENRLGKDALQQLLEHTERMAKRSTDKE
jgi:transcriptional regulator with XRE-family HTH domain